MRRVNKLKSALYIILGVGLAFGVTRFIFGLGVTTNLTDNTPWGFWIGFDVMGGVALAGGGFVIAALNYIFKNKVFHAVSRAAILTAFLGYIAVVIGLLFDLGLPWNIWHMVIFWNPHSPLFEVGWCVMLYLSVLFLEFAPVVLEKYPGITWMAKLHKFLYKLRIPLVILGIMLSTLHQSSLGSLFLAMPYKLHPLWYTPIIPIMFFVSAILLGLMMVTVESRLSSYLYHREPESDVIYKLGKYAAFMVVFYAVLRFGDIFVRGAGQFLTDATWGTYLFWIEVAVTMVLPLFFFVIPWKKFRVNFIFTGALIGVIGIVFNRLNVGGLTHLNNLSNIGDFYFPSITEFFISAAVVAFAMLVFFYFIENYKIWEHPPKDESDLPKSRIRFGAGHTYFGPTKAANRTVFSLVFVVSFSIGFAVLSGETIYSEGYEKVEVTKARGGDTLLVDGNRDGYGVNFKHKFHEDMYPNCVECHHMNKPDDESTGCYECHNNMYTEFDAFRHDWHASETGGAQKCFDCHEEGKYKTKETAADCSKCHDDLIPKGSTIEMKDYMAPSYVDALHKMCIGCHRDVLENDPKIAAENPYIDQCTTCHPPGVKYDGDKKIFEKQMNKWVVVPPKMVY